jgi:hypothetical protein
MLSRCGWILIVVSVSLLSAFAQNGLRPEIRVRPISLEMAPQVPMSLFPTPWGGTSPYQSDFFPAAPTTLFDNTSPTGYYFPVSNIVFDDADIPESRDTDGDDIYFLTQWNIAFYVPGTAQQPVIASFYLAPPTATGGVDFGAMLAIENVSLGELTPGSYIVTITFPRCTPYQMQTLQITGSDGNLYDLFWVGLKFPQYCAPLYSGGGPGWLLADGPDYQGDIFYWDGDYELRWHLRGRLLLLWWHSARFVLYQGDGRRDRKRRYRDYCRYRRQRLCGRRRPACRAVRVR